MDELAVEFDGKVKVVKSNVSDSFEAAGTYGVRMLPTVLLFKGGQPTAQLTSLRSKDDLKGEIEKALG